MSDPWDRQPGETDKARAAFERYLALGPWRSHRELAAQLYDGRTSGLRLINEWSRKNAWVDRARAWDAAQAVKIREELAAQRLALARQVMQNAAQLNQTIPEDLRGVSAYTKMALDASRTETGLPSEVGEVRHAGHDGGPLPTPDLARVSLRDYADAASEVAGEDD